MFDGSLEALQIVADPVFLAIVVFATVIGTIAAILPGISPGTMMALLIPITFGMDKFEAFGFLVALMAAGGFAGSMTSILLNVPGDGINAATTLDGFPLARQGKAGLAIGASAAASGLGAVFGLVILVLSIPIMRQVILVFGPPEFFALALAGVMMIATISARSPIKGVTAGLLGMVIGFVGVNFTVGGTRYTMDIDMLEDGIRLVPALIGLFAIPELFELIKRNETIARGGFTVAGGVWEGVREVLRRPVLFFRSAAIGTFVGIVPGVGGSVASWVAYFAAVNSSKNPESFGKGNIEGVIAPEAAVDAKEGGSMMPVLALGLPASVSTAILLTAFQIHGVFPGERLFTTDIALVWVMILAMVFANLTTSALGLAFANQMVKVTLIPATILAPVIFGLGAIGSFADQRSLFGLALMLFFGGLGIVMMRHGFPRPPLLVGMILLPLAEVNFFRSTQIHRGEYIWLTRPLVLAIFGLILVVLLLPFVRRIISERKKAQDAGTSHVETGQSGNPISLRGQAMFVGAALVVAVLMLLETANFPANARTFPQVILVPLIGLLGFILVRTLLRLARYGERAPVAKEVGERPDWWVAGWVLLLPAFVYVLGVLPGMAVYIATFILGFQLQRPTVRRAALAAGLSIGMFLAMYYSFVEALGIRFYEGLFS